MNKIKNKIIKLTILTTILFSIFAENTNACASGCCFSNPDPIVNKRMKLKCEITNKIEEVKEKITFLLNLINTKTQYPNVKSLAPRDFNSEFFIDNSNADKNNLLFDFSKLDNITHNLKFDFRVTEKDMHFDENLKIIKYPTITKSLSYTKKGLKELLNDFSETYLPGYSFDDNGDIIEKIKIGKIYKNSRLIEVDSNITRIYTFTNKH